MCVVGWLLGWLLGWNEMNGGLLYIIALTRYDAVKNIRVNYVCARVHLSDPCLAYPCQALMAVKVLPRATSPCSRSVP